MYKNKKVGVVVPAYNEEKLIGRVIKTIPAFVDKIIVVDDLSKDHTVEKVRGCQEELGEKLILIKHDKNRGVGAALVTGYKKAIDLGMDVTAVMAGDAQMDPGELDKIIAPVVKNQSDYVKGNRLFTGKAWEMIPRHRYLGNALLSLLTKIASGYWHIADSQAGYTAISSKALKALRLDGLYPGYGYPNHLLVKLNVHNFRVRDIPIRPIYDIGEKSEIKLYKMIPRVSWLLLQSFLWRMKEKYIIRDFHPLVFFYGLSFVLFVLTFFLFVRLLWVWHVGGSIPKVNALGLLFTLITGFQSLFFGMWFDMENNKDLK